MAGIALQAAQSPARIAPGFIDAHKPPTTPMCNSSVEMEFATSLKLFYNQNKNNLRKLRPCAVSIITRVRTRKARAKH